MNTCIHSYELSREMGKTSVYHTLSGLYLHMHFKYLVSHKYVFGLSKVTQYLRFPSHVLIWSH